MHSSILSESQHFFITLKTESQLFQRDLLSVKNLEHKVSGSHGTTYITIKLWYYLFELYIYIRVIYFYYYQDNIMKIILIIMKMILHYYLSTFYRCKRKHELKFKKINAFIHTQFV